jgi:ribose transport system permease protein
MADAPRRRAARSRDLARRAGAAFSQQSGSWILIVLILLVAFFTLTSPSGTFFTVFNLQTLLGDGSEVLILAIAGLIVIISGGIDLSLGSLMTLAATIAFLTMHHLGENAGWPVIIAGIVAGVGAATAWGAFNGILIAYAKIPPFVVTLGSLGAALGVARLLLKGGSFASIAPVQFGDTFGLSQVFSIPTPFLIAAGTAIICGLQLAFTRLGEHIYMTGANPEGARRAGIAVGRTGVAVYALSGALAGVAGTLDFARFNSVDISTGHTQLLIASIAAVIIGGASLTGGVGTAAGTTIAVFIPVVLNNGLIILGAQPFWQDIIVGAMLVLAVGFDQWRRARANRPRRAQRAAAA